MALITKAKHETITMAELLAAMREQIVPPVEDDRRGKGTTDESGRPLQSA